MFHVKSKSSGSYFGRYASQKAAQCDAEVANEEKKNGMEDWEPEEKEEGMDEVEMALGKAAEAVEMAKKSYKGKKK